MISSISTVSISLEYFLPSILLLMVIIVAVVIVMVIWEVFVVVGGVSFIIKLSFMVIGFFLRTILLYQESFQFRPGDLIGFFYSNRLDPPGQSFLSKGTNSKSHFVLFGTFATRKYSLRISLGSVFLLELSEFAMAAACTFRAEEMPLLISCRMASKVMTDVSDVDTEIMIQMMEMMMKERDKLETIRYILSEHFPIPEEVEEEDKEWIHFLGGNSSSGTKKYRGSNSSDGGNTGDGVKIAGEVIGFGDEIEFSEELKELLPDEAGKYSDETEV
ncbi:hypothetical protein Tco_0523477 [Tanacetum coccineum]